MDGSTSVIMVTIQDLHSLEDQLAGLDDPHELGHLDVAKRRMLESNPCVLPQDPAVFVAVSGPVDGKRIVGRIDVVPGRFVVDGVVQRVWYGSDFRVPAAERGTMAALILIAELKRQCHPLAASGPSRVATELYSRLGWQDFPLVRMVVPVNPFKILGASRRKDLAGRCVGGIAELLRPVCGWGIGTVSRLAGHLPMAERFEKWEPSIGDLGKSRECQAGPLRDASWLKWLLDNQRSQEPGEGATLLVARYESGSPRSLLLLATRRYPDGGNHPAAGLFVASLKDWWCDQTKDLPLVLAHAIREGARQKVDCVELPLPVSLVDQIPRGVPAFDRGTQRMMFDLTNGDPMLSCLAELRAGDGEAFWS